MKKNKAIAPLEFTKGIDRDTDIHFTGNGAYRDALNMEPNPGSNGSERRIALGNEEIEYDFGLTHGDLNTSGSVENKEGDFMVMWVSDDGTEDYLLWTDGEKVKLLLNGRSVLETAKGPANERVHSAAIVEGRYLYWTNAVYWNSDTITPQISGSKPKKLDIDRHLPKPSINYELVLNANAYSAGTIYRYEVTNRFGDTISGPTIFYIIPAAGQRNDIITALVNALGAIPNLFVTPPSVNTIDQPAPRILFSYFGAQEGDRVVISAAGIPGAAVAQSELNFYPVDIEDKHIALIKPCPLFEPEVQYVKDSDDENYIRSTEAFQFRYRYIFDDGEKSAWGPASIVPTNYLNAISGEPYYAPDPEFNRIDISLNQDRKLRDNAWRTYIRKIEVAYRTSKESIWKLIDSYDIYDFDYEDITIPFYGTGVNTAVPSDEDASSTAQALKNFDFVPRKTTSLEFVYDESGNGVLLLGGGLYGYNVIQPKADVTVNARVLDAAISGTAQVSKAKSLKRGGKYKIAVAFKDWAGRQTPAFFLKEVTIPWAQGKEGDYTENEVYALSGTMLGAAPGDFSAYQFLITENLNQAVWWRSQRNTDNPAYLKYDLDTGDLVDVVDDRADADYIAFDAFYTGDISDVVFFENFGANQAFVTPESGDRVQIISWADNAANPPGTVAPEHIRREDYNYQIAGYVFGSNSTGPYIRVLVKIADDIPDWYWVNRVSIEIYRPKQVENADVYYEFGPVGEINFIYGATDLSGYGDVYVTKQESQDFSGGATPPDPVMQEYTDPSFLNRSAVPDHGRAVPVDPGYKEQFNTSIIRASDIFVPNSEVNGLSSFRSTSFIYVNPALGPITKLILNQTVLLAITVSKTQPIYVAKDRLLSLNGASQVGRTSQLLNLASELRYDYGTANPESVVYEQGYTYALDRQKGVMWRYSTGNGQQPISELGLFNFFRATADINSTQSRPLIIAGFDRGTDLLHVNIGDITAVFSEKHGWVSFSNDTPEVFQPLNIKFITSQNGRLFVRTEKAPRANYNGTQYDAKIKGIFNQGPAVKLPDIIEINSTGQWYVSDVDIPANPSYPVGQNSRIPHNRFTYYEGHGKAPFLRDLNDPAFSTDAEKITKGRAVRGKAMTVELQAVDASLANIIRIAYIYYHLSRQTTTE